MDGSEEKWKKMNQTIAKVHAVSMSSLKDQRALYFPPCNAISNVKCLRLKDLSVMSNWQQVLLGHPVL